MDKLTEMTSTAVTNANIQRIPAWLDFLQSASGLFLTLFMWAHMAFVSSILISEDAMYRVTRFFEGEYFFGKPYPGIVTFIVALVFLIFIAHAALALRKFPSSYRQYRVFLATRKRMQHSDTGLWLIQVITGFAMLFLGTAHLYTMLTHSADIGPYASADRVWSDGAWLLDLLLLLAVEFHGGLGFYRLAVKWGWFEGSDPRRNRMRLKRFVWGLIGFLLLLGILSLSTYMKIGIEHADKAGERYRPAVTIQTPYPGVQP
jgi:fumarate reductase subunit C